MRPSYGSEVETLETCTIYHDSSENLCTGAEYGSTAGLGPGFFLSLYPLKLLWRTYSNCNIVVTCQLYVHECASI